MRAALHAEWTKMRTVAAPWWLMLGAVVATVTLSAAGAAVATELSLLGVYLGQAPVCILGVLVMSGEHSTGLIRVTLAAAPRRGRVLAAKAIVLTGVVAIAGTVAVLGSLLAASPTLRASAGSILYLILVAQLSLGIATIVRDAATSIGVVLGLLYLFPILARTVGDPHWQRLLEKIEPTSAGPWAGLGATAGWAAAALLIGGLLLRARDA